MDNGEKHITIIDEQGNEHLCEILFTFDSEDTGKSYVVYSPIGEVDEEGDPIYHASSFIPSEDEQDGDLFAIETDEEWEMIEEILNTFLDDEDEDLNDEE